MKRYATKIEAGTIHVECDDGWLEVGTTDDLVDLVGGETYEIEYDPDVGAAYDWLDTDDEGRMTFDVLEVVESMSYPEEFVAHIEGTPMDPVDGYPRRTAFFADMLTRIWDTKGDLEDEEDQPGPSN